MPRVSDEAMYEGFAKDYAAHVVDSPYNALYDRPAMLALAGEVCGLRVLDAGCGPGLYAQELLRRGATVVGFDQSPALVDLARRRVGAGAVLRVHDLAEPLHWAGDASFDLVVLALTLNYVDDRVSMLRELRRVLRPHGALLISTTHPTADWQRLGGSYFAVEPVESSLSPQHDWPVRAWRRPLTHVCREFREAGFWIEDLVEPRPVAEMASRYPADYARLEHAPAFVAFRLRPTP
jgi:SAM-dependent methyltransferase